MSPIPWITLLTLVPILGALVVLAVGAANQAMARRTALCFAFLSLAITLVLWHKFNPAISGFQFVEVYPWISPLNANYHVGIDGLGLLMVLLSAIVVTISMVASRQIERQVPLYFALVLMLESCLFGTFTALSFIHWFIFWELGLIPAFFLVKLWGGPKSSKAAMQFLVYTMVGSITMLMSFLAIYLVTGSFDFVDIARMAQSGRLLPAVVMKLGWHTVSPYHAEMLIFAGAFLGFAVKVPLIPFHTWLPSTYAEAPTGTTILLTGAMSKMGLYGFLRILLPFFGVEMQHVLTPLLWLAVATIVLSAFAALAQTDLKRVFAYSSINHLGYCMLAIFAVAKFTGTDTSMMSEKFAAMDGVFLQMFNHGLTAATLFWFIAMLETRSGGLRGLNDFGGLRRAMPVFTGLMGIALFSSLGLPGLNGFIGEFLIFKGSFPLVTWASALSVVGLLITAVFILGVLQKVFYGALPERWATLPDLTLREQLSLAPAILLMFVLGLYPQLVLGVVNHTAMQMALTLRNF
jgi:NADH-quinone oxidoreductase subunit M